MITGASRGLGRAVAEAFGAEGAHVGIGYRVQAEAAEASLEAVRSVGGSGVCVPMDVRDAASVRSAMSSFEEARPIEVLVCSAAVVHDQPFVMTSPDEWARVVETNLNGTYHSCRAVLPAMMARGRGSIVTIGSASAARATTGQASYSASKAGVVALTRGLAKEVIGHGIRVNCVVPGLLSTGMGARLDRRQAERYLDAIPRGRLGSGREVADAVLFLASEEAAYVVGATITVDGGLTL